MNQATLRLLYAALTLVGAFLSFEIQPLVGKIVTAGFGGSAAIWGVCLLFFQAVLLCGYALTCILSSLTPRRQSIAYGLIVLGSAACLNLPGPAGWLTDTQAEIAQSLLVVLAAHLAFPCLILSSISGMMQTWFNLSRLGNPYPLYSLSNIGSLSALLSYPLLIEPNLSLTRTIDCWKVSYYLLVFLVCLSCCHMFSHKGPAPTTPAARGDSVQDPQAPQANSPGEPEPGLRDFAWWITLSAMGTLALVSYTAYLTQDIAPVPLIYVIPLCLYLVSFIITFAGRQWYRRGVLIYLTPLLWMAEAGISALWVDKTHLTQSMLWSITAVLSFMFCFFLTCQGELYSSKPAAKYLASFYLAIAFGGTLGGAFVNFGAPALFNTYMERYIIGAFIILLWAGVVFRTYHGRPLAQIANYTFALISAGSFILLLLANQADCRELLCQKRNFFGCVSVSGSDESITLHNGRIMHGQQFKDADRKRLPTLYYAKGTGLDLIDGYLRRSHRGEPLKYGLVGLGAGTIAAYGRPGDQFVFYEIDPKVIACAHRYFSFLSDSKAAVSVLAGDARWQLKRQAKQKFDLLVIDAFNGDAIPVHLLTRESINIYFSHLKPDGILLVHVTNRFIELEPVLGNLASALNLRSLTLSTGKVTYVALCRLPDFQPSEPGDLQWKDRFKDLDIRAVNRFSSIGIWTDDYSNLFATMMAKWQRRPV